MNKYVYMFEHIEHYYIIVLQKSVDMRNFQGNVERRNSKHQDYHTFRRVATSPVKGLIFLH